MSGDNAERPRLSLNAIIDVALNIVDRDGIDAVSMRSVANHFGTGPASLYAHVANKDEILRRVLERVVDEVSLPVGDVWQDMLRAWAYETRRVFIEHNDVAVLSFGTIPVTPRMLGQVESLLSVMAAGGVPKQVAAWALDIMSLYVAADAYEGALMARRFSDGTGRPPEEVGYEYFQDIARGFAGLPTEKFPHLLAHLDLMMSGDGDARFAFGIDMLIAGIAAQVGRG